MAARAAYEYVNGSLPGAGENVHATCGNTLCVNPGHQTVYTGKRPDRQEVLEARAASYFWERTELLEDGCMNWCGHVTNSGYGTLHIGNRQVAAHRYAMELATGAPVSPHLVVCHKCDNPRCVNPEHLFVGTHSDNVRDMHSKGRSSRKQHDKSPWKARGLRSPRALLSDEQVIEIRKRYAEGESQVALGKEFGVSNDCVHTVVTNRVYKNLPSFENPAVRGDTTTLSKEALAQMLEGFRAGKTQTELAAEYGISQQTVFRLLTTVGGHKPKARMSKEDLDRARAMLAAGEMQRTVARTLNVSEATISRIANQITA